MKGGREVGIRAEGARRQVTAKSMRARWQPARLRGMVLVFQTGWRARLRMKKIGGIRVMEARIGSVGIDVWEKAPSCACTHEWWGCKRSSNNTSAGQNGNNEL